MNDNSKYGRTTFEKVNVLPELTFDMLEGEPASSALGKTHTPVTVLPPLAFDMLDRHASESPDVE